MPTPRIFQKIPLQIDETITLTLESAHYLGNVRRTRENDDVIIFNGEGGEFLAKVLLIKKDKFTLKILSFRNINNESPLNIHLAQGIARGEKMDFIIQKSVELGIKKIMPVFTERSTVKLEHEKKIKRQEHWQSAAISACEQSGRNFIPEITVPIEFGAWIRNFSGKGIILSPYSTSKLSTLSFEQSEPITILVGPEGGLSEAEVNLALESDFTSINLGPRILRTETAPLAILAMLQSRFGDMG